MLGANPDVIARRTGHAPLQQEDAHQAFLFPDNAQSICGMKKDFLLGPFLCGTVLVFLRIRGVHITGKPSLSIYKCLQGFSLIYSLDF